MGHIECQGTVWRIRYCNILLELSYSEPGLPVYSDRPDACGFHIVIARGEKKISQPLSSKTSSCTFTPDAIVGGWADNPEGDLESFTAMANLPVLSGHCMVIRCLMTGL
jgi:hypothetical protein